MEEIPEVKDSGSSGTQGGSSDIMAPITREKAMEGLIMHRAIEGLAAARPKGMGGEVVANLLSGAFGQLSQELTGIKEELRNSQYECNKAFDKLSECKERVATLTERVRLDSRNRHLRNFGIFAGTVLISNAIGFSKSQSNIGWIFVAIGVLLVIISWLSVPKEAEK